MSRWNPYGYPRSTKKRPPPETGIRVKNTGTTWWGQRWIDALESVLSGDAKRLKRGRTYARGGRTHDLVVKGGKVKAKVTGSRATPYSIVIELAQFDDSTWQLAIAGMSTKAQFTAELLAGQMPREIDQVFESLGKSLFPKTRTELRTTCSCPDWGDPCKHVAATHYVLGEALDGDPFLLFELRGRTKSQVLDALRNARSGSASASLPKRAAQANAPPDPIPSVNLGRLKATEYEQLRAPLPTLHFAFEVPTSHGLVLRQLGPLSGWEETESPAETFAPVLQVAAEAARELALEDPTEQSETEVIERPKPRRPRPSNSKPSSSKLRSAERTTKAPKQG